MLYLKGPHSLGKPPRRAKFFRSPGRDRGAGFESRLFLLPVLRALSEISAVGNAFEAQALQKQARDRRVYRRSYWVAGAARLLGTPDARGVVSNQ
jgi:hypothetical protein